MSEIHDMPATEPLFGTQMGVTAVHTHPRSRCEWRDIPCCIHAPSGHHMRNWPMNWRSDTVVMERTCPHGVGHPDPDHMAYVTSLDEDNEWQGVHGCDGCCHE
jgi:hypothetical protein